MHILLIHQAFAALDEPGGTRHHELARGLVERGHQVTIIASPVSYLTGKAHSEHIPWVTRQRDGDSITILRAYTIPALHRSFFYRVFSFLSFMFSSFIIGLGVKDVDLVWGTSPPIFQGLTAWALSRLRAVPFLFEVRDLWPAFAVAVGVLRQPLLIRSSEWLERFLYRSAHTVMVNSPGFIDHVRSRGARRIEFVPNGSDMRMFQPDLNGYGFRQMHGLTDKFILLYAGAHGMSNDLGVVLDAASRLANRSNLAFVLLGDGKEKPALISRAKEMKLTNLIFLPPLPKTEMHQALAAADACIAILLPLELYKTVYPNKVFDYMAAGRPVVLAIDGVIRKVIEEANCGIFVPPGDPQAMADVICKLADSQDLVRKLGSNGRQYLEEHFDRSALALRLAEIMEGIAYKV
jgi:glycosyltransferase involved in cell wall biosynthesis